MGRGSVKRFVEKRSARTFKLVPRSTAGDDTGDHSRVFVEITPGAERRELENIADAFGDTLKEPGPKPSGAAGEAARYGVLFDDRQYDYCQHLKAVGEVPGGVLVSTPDTPQLDEQSYLEELREVDATVYQNAKQVVTDPDLLEVLCALEDGSEIGDDFVAVLDRETDEGSDICVDDEANLARILQELSSNDISVDDSISGMDEKDLAQIKNGNGDGDVAIDDPKKRGFAEIDEMRKALLADGPLLVPSEPSDFDSDEYFASSASSEGDCKDSRQQPVNGPQVIIEQIAISKKSGLPIQRQQTETANPAVNKQPRDNLGARRDKQETPEEKKLRKAAIKSARKGRRGEKKEHQALFNHSN